ncbi:MAG: metabolite traffic protein EboE [Verrucomicrobiota bacterium]
MKLANDIHLGYCTNIHRGETWSETFQTLRDYTMAVRDRVSKDQPYGIGLRLGADAAAELASPASLEEFRCWLADENSYVFTINGFPYGKFHGTRVKEQVYAPDWTKPERLIYTNQLFDLIADLAPEGEAGSVSTLPGSFKEFIEDDSQVDVICDNLIACSRYIEELRQRTGRDLHLGLEPEPLGMFETSTETVAFFEKLLKRSDEPSQILQNIGVNYDTCHLAVEYEDADDALGRLTDAGIRISKLHLSSALSLKPNAAALQRLSDFQEDVYLHQVVIQQADGELRRYRDLDEALMMATDLPDDVGEEWRVHFHVPLHAEPLTPFGDTREHLQGTLDVLAKQPDLCQHLEMETYTWEVLPEEMRSVDVVDQLDNEYRWTLAEMAKRGLSAG